MQEHKGGTPARSRGIRSVRAALGRNIAPSQESRRWSGAKGTRTPDLLVAKAAPGPQHDPERRGRRCMACMMCPGVKRPEHTGGTRYAIASMPSIVGLGRPTRWSSTRFARRCTSGPRRRRLNLTKTIWSSEVNVGSLLSFLAWLAQTLPGCSSVGSPATERMRSSRSCVFAASAPEVNGARRSRTRSRKW
jgi:hypothetical protein